MRVAFIPMREQGRAAVRNSISMTTASRMIISTVSGCGRRSRCEKRRHAKSMLGLVARDELVREREAGMRPRFLSQKMDAKEAAGYSRRWSAAVLVPPRSMEEWLIGEDALDGGERDETLAEARAVVRDPLEGSSWPSCRRRGLGEESGGRNACVAAMGQTHPAAPHKAPATAPARPTPHPGPPHELPRDIAEVLDRAQLDEEVDRLGRLPPDARGGGGEEAAEGDDPLVRGREFGGEDPGRADELH